MSMPLQLFLWERFENLALEPRAFKAPRPQLVDGVEQHLTWPREPCGGKAASLGENPTDRLDRRGGGLQLPAL